MSALVFPPLRKPIQSKTIRIEIGADSMRVGKSTAVAVLSEGLRKQGMTVTESYEDWQHNPYLKESYSDPAKHFLDSQKWFVHRKWEQIRDGGTTDVFIQDVAPETDFCYAATNLSLGRMSQADFDAYARYYEQLDWEVAPAPDLLIYLCVSDDELLRRAMDARREFETVDPTYFLMMKKVNREWLKQAKHQMNILEIDTDTFNFANNNDAQRALLDMVSSNLQLHFPYKDL